jgi:hypothetical protein
MRTTLAVLVLAAGCGSSPAPTKLPVAAPGPVAQPTRQEPPPTDEESAPPKPESRTPRYDARTFYDTVAIRGASFSHDGQRILVSSDATGVFNVYSQPVAGGAPVQLTKSTKDSRLATFPRMIDFCIAPTVAGTSSTTCGCVSSTARRRI